MDSFQLGPLTVRYVWLFLLTALFFAYIIIDVGIKKVPDDKRKLLYNILSNSFMIILVCYKFSYILYRPSIIWENPIGIIYFTGGWKGLILGGIIALFYLYRQFKMHHLNQWRYWKLIVYGFVTFVVIYYVVQTIFSLLI